MTKFFKLDKCRIRVNECRPTGWRTNGSGRFSKRKETIEFGCFAYGTQPNITVLVENGVKAGSETLDCRSTIFPGFLQGSNTGGEFGYLIACKGLCPAALRPVPWDAFDTVRRNLDKVDILEQGQRVWQKVV